MLLITTFGLSTMSQAQEGTTPKLEYFMSVHYILDNPLPAAKHRLVVNIEDGWIKMSDGTTGKVVSPSGDWLHIQPNGVMKMDMRIMLKMDDGGAIFCEYYGRLLLTKIGAAQFSKGELIASKDINAIVMPRCSSMHPKYAWLKTSHTLAKMVRFQPPNKEGKPIHARYDYYIIKP